jgi:hypothetical protein
MTFKNFSRIAFLPALIYIINLVLGYGLDIYHKIRWFDTPMHFIGGITIALSAHLYFQSQKQSGAIGKINKWNLFLILIGTVALAGVLWEIYEFSLDQLIYHYAYFQPSNFDTMKDLIMDLLGGSAAAIILLIKKPLNKN